MVKMYKIIRTDKNDNNIKEKKVYEKKKEFIVNKNYNFEKRHKFVKNKIKLKNIDISLMRKINEINSLPFSYENDGIGSYFYDELENLNNYEHSEEWIKFYLNIVDKSQTLSIILWSKDEIVENILDLLNYEFLFKNCFKLLMALLRDLKDEIYINYREKIFPKIVNFINIDNIPKLQIIFNLIAGSFKFLLKSITSDINNFYKVFINIYFQFKNEAIKRFSIESFGYIIKKSKNENQLKFLIKKIFLNEINENYEDINKFLGFILFENMKGFSNLLSFQIINIYNLIIEFFIESEKYEDLKEIFRISINKYIDYEFNLKKNSNSSSNEAIYFKDLLTNILYKNSYYNTNEKYLEIIIEILMDLVINRNGKILNDNKNKEEIMNFFNKFKNFNNHKTIINLIVVLNHLRIDIPLNILENLNLDLNNYEYLLKELIMEEDIKKRIKYIYETNNKNTKENNNINKTINDINLENFIIKYFNLIFDNININVNHKNTIYYFSILIKSKIDVSDMFFDSIINQINNLLEYNNFDLFIYSNILNIIKFKSNISEQILNNIINNDQLNKSSNNSNNIYYYIKRNKSYKTNFSIEYLINILSKNLDSKYNYDKILIEFCMNNINCYYNLDTLLNIMNKNDNSNFKYNQNNYLVYEENKVLFNKLSCLLMNKSKKIKIKAINLLNKFDINQISLNLNYYNNFKFLDILNKFESIEINLENERFITSLFTNLKLELLSNKINEVYYLPIVYFLISYAFKRFIIIEELVQNIIQIIINKNDNYFNKFVDLIIDYKNHLYLKYNENNNIEEDSYELFNIYEKDMNQNINRIEQIKHFDILIKCIKIDDNNNNYDILNIQVYNLLKQSIINDYLYNNILFNFYKEIFKLKIKENNTDIFLQFYNKNNKSFKNNLYEKVCQIYFINLLKTLLNNKSLNKYEFKDDLYSIFLILLKYNNESYKEIAFKGIFLFENKVILSKQKLLKNIYNQKEVKSAIFNLNLNNLTIMERSYLIPIVINMIISILTETKTGKSKKFNENKKYLLLNYFSNLKENEIGLFINEILLNYNFKMNYDKNKMFLAISKLNPKKILNFIKFIKLLIKSFRIILIPYLSNLIEIIFYIYDFIKEYKNYLNLNYEKEIVNRNKNNMRILKKNIFKLVTDIYSNYVEYEFLEINDKVYNILSKNWIDYKKSNFNKISYILNLLCVWSEYELYKINFLKYNELKNIFYILKNENIERNVEELILNLIHNLLTYSIIEKEDIKINHEKTINNYISEYNNNNNNCFIINKENNFKISLLGKKFFNLNIDLIVDCFDVYFNNKRNNFSSKKILNQRNLESLLILLENIDDLNNENSLKLINIFKEFLNPKFINKNISFVEELFISADKLIYIEKDIENKVKVLKIISKIIKNIINPIEFIYEHLLPLLISVNNFKILYSLNNIFDSLIDNKNCRSILSSLKLIKKMLSKEKKLNESLNYQNIYKVLENINNEYINQLDINNIKILSVFIIKLFLENDMVVRNYSIEFFKIIFSKFSSYSLEIKKDFNNFLVNLILPNLTLSLNKCKYNESFNTFISFYDIYISFITNNLNSFEDPENIPLIDISKEYNKNKELMFFFENITSIKISTKIKSLDNLKKFIINSKNLLNSNSIRTFLIPLINIIIDGNIKESKENMNGKIKESRVNTIKNLLNACVDCMGILVSYFEIREFCNFLKEKIFFMKKNQYYEKIIIKIISKSLENLPEKFNDYDIIKKVNIEVKEKLFKKNKNSIFNKIYNYDKETNLNQFRSKAIDMINEEEKINEFDKDELNKFLETKQIDDEIIKVDNNENSLTVGQIKLLKNKILLPLKQYLNEKTDNGKMIKIQIASSIIKIIRLLPFNIFKIEFIKIIYNICSNLKNKSQETRNNARTTLLEICKSTGPYFFYFILNEMKILLSNGLVKHIRNYTMGYLLENLISKENGFENGTWDNCINLIVEFILDEIFGDINEEKEAKEIQNKSTELKKTNAFQSLKLLGLHINFDTIFTIIDLFKNYFKGSSINVNKIINKSEIAFNWLINGIVNNKNLDTKNFIYLTYVFNKNSNLVQKFDENKIDNIEYNTENYMDNYNKNMKEKFKLQEGVAQNKSIFNQIKKNKEKRNEILNKTICVFSINLLYKSLKKGKIRFENLENNESLVNDFYKIIDQLVILLDSQYNEIVSGSLNIISIIYDNPIFEFKNNSRRLINSITRILSSLTVNDLEMLTICFKMIKKIILSGFIEIASSKMNAILNYLKEFLYISDFILEPLHCFDAIIYKKIIKPDIYDLIEKCIEIFIKSNQPNIRNLSKNVIINFVISYPLNNDYYKNFINKLLKNLDLDQKDNKLDLIILLTEIIENFPNEILINNYNTMYFSLITNIVNEKEIECNNKLKNLLFLLLSKINNFEEKINEIYNYCKVWIKKENNSLKLSSIITIIILIKLNNKIKDNVISDELINKEINLILADAVNEINNYKAYIREMKKNKEIINEENYDNKLNNKIDLFRNLIDFYKELILNSNKQNFNIYLENVFKFMYHPNEYILKDIIKNLFWIFDNLDGEYELLNDNLKDIILFSYIIIRKKDIIEQETIFSFYAIVKELLNYLINFDEEILNNYVLGLKEIILKNIRELESNIVIIERIIIILNLFLSQENIKIGEDVGTNLIEILVKLKENNQIQSNIDLLETLEDFYSNLKKHFKTDFILKNYSNFKNIIIKKREEIKNKNKIEAITNPEAYAKKKVLLSKKRRLKKMEKIKKNRINQDNSNIKKIN